MVLIMKRWLTETLGAATGLVVFVVMMGLAIGGIVSGSFALDDWFGTPDWLSVVIMLALVVFMPPAAALLAIIGLFYWP